MLDQRLTDLHKRHGIDPELVRLLAYPFFLMHLFLFGGLGFLMAYAGLGVSPVFLYAHGLFAVLFFLPFYGSVFGRDEMRWMLINSTLGIVGICSEMNWLLAAIGTGKTLGDYPWYVHPVPFLYYVLYTFLLRQVVLDLTRAREPGTRRTVVEYSYVVLSLIIHAAFYLSAT